MTFIKRCTIMIALTIPFGYLAEARAQQTYAKDAAFTVSAAAMDRIAIALGTPMEAPVRHSPEKRPLKETGSNQPTPTAAIAFGITLLAAPVSMGGLFSR